MKKLVAIGAVLAALAGLASAELLLNGDFEQTLDVGWKETTYQVTGNFSYDRWDTMGQPTPGYAARSHKYLAKYAALAQTVLVDNVDLTLSFDARFQIGGGSSTCWPVAAFIIRYRDISGNELGNTKYYKHDAYATWANSDTAHLIDVSGVSGWQNYALDLRQEVTSSLPGVNPDLVRNVSIEIYAYDNGT